MKGVLITHRTTLADVPRDLPRWAHQKQGLIKAVIAVSACPVWRMKKLLLHFVIRIDELTTIETMGILVD